MLPKTRLKNDLLERICDFRAYLQPKCPKGVCLAANWLGIWTNRPPPLYKASSCLSSKTQMYTHSNVYAKKISSGTILAILAISALILLLPLSPVHASTGHPTLGTVTSASALTGWVQATSFVGAKAGTDGATNDANTPLTGHFASCFSCAAPSGVSFSGSVFYLYLSRDGLSSISAGDVRYAGPFNVADLQNAAVVTTKMQANGTFYLGTVGGIALLSGPIPISISSAYDYIKVFDGSSGAVAVSSQTVSINPGITVSPSSGAAGVGVTLKGGGFPANMNVNINYSFTYVAWNDATSTKKGAWITGIATGSGYFSSPGTMIDAKQPINTNSFQEVTTAISLFAVNASKISQTFPSATATFTENSRFLSEVVSYDNTGTAIDTTNAYTHPSAMYGNDTESTGTGVTNLVQPIDVAVLGTLYIAGNNSLVSSAVTFWVSGTQIGSTTSDAGGNFNGTAQVPALSKGVHTVLVQNNGVNYQFTIDVLPTMILTPSSGPVGTVVAVTVYGFPGNQWINIYWQGITSGDTSYYFEGNGTVASNGQLNVTLTFAAPAAVGGAHTVAATNLYHGANPSSATVVADEIATSTFTITPTLVICVTTTSCGAGDTSADTKSVNANTRGLISAVGTGFEDFDYQVNIDNAMYNDYEIFSSSNGNIYMNFTTAGFRPGLHQVEFFLCCVGSDGAHSGRTPYAWAYFNVTTTGDYISGQFSSVTAAVNNLGTSVTAIQTSLTNIQNSLATITTDVSGLGSQLTTIQTSLTTITTDVSGLGSQLTTISNSLTTIQGSLTAAAADAHTAATQAQAAATAAQNAVNNNSSLQTYVLVVAALAAITLVLVLAVLVRKLS